MTTEENTPSLEDVLSHAIETGDVSGTLDGGKDDPAPPAGDDLDADGDVGAGDDPNADGSAALDAEAGKPDPAAAEQSDEAGKVRDPVTGKFVKKDADGAGDKGAAKPGEPKPGEKPGDKPVPEPK